MGITEIVANAAACIPHGVTRDSANRLYVVGSNTSTSDLDCWLGNAAGTSWTKYDINTGSGGRHASVVTGTYSGTEYVWVIAWDNWTIKTYRSVVGDTLSFSEIDSAASTYSFGGCALYVNNVLYYAHQSDAGFNNAHIRKSTDGGDTSSEISDSIYDGNMGVSEAAISYPGSGDYIYCFWTSGSGSQSAYCKRLDITTDNMEYWDGNSWEDSTDSDNGDNTGARFGSWLFSSADSNIIIVAGGGVSLGQASISLDGAETWDTISGMGLNNYVWGSCTLDSISDIYVWASDSDTDQDATSFNKYDYSGTSWGGWTEITDYADADIIDSIVGLTAEHNGYIDFLYRRFDDDSSTYRMYINQYVEGAGALDGEDVKAASTRIKIQAEDVKAASTRIAYKGEDVKSASTRIAYSGEETKEASTRIKIQTEVVKAASTNIRGWGQSIKSASTRIALISEDVKSASTRIKIQTEDVKSASTRIKRLTEDVKLASTRISLPSTPAEDVKLASSRIKRLTESVKLASTRIAYSGEDTKSASTRIKRINESIKSASTRIALISEDVKAASTRIKRISESIKSASTRIAYKGESVKAASTRIAYSGEDVKAASTRIQIVAVNEGEDVKLASTRIAYQGESVKAASTQIRFRLLYSKKAKLYNQEQSKYTKKSKIYKQM